MAERKKTTMNVLNAHSLRDIVSRVNAINAQGGDITRDDIVGLKHLEGEFFLLYFE